MPSCGHPRNRWSLVIGPKAVCESVDSVHSNFQRQGRFLGGLIYPKPCSIYIPHICLTSSDYIDILTYPKGRPDHQSLIN